MRRCRAEADKLAKDLLDAAQRKGAQADGLARREDYPQASAAYREAAQAYDDATRRAGLLRPDRALADQSRVRMQAEKQKAQPNAREYTAGLNQEKQGDTTYGRLAFKEAASHYDAARDLFARATAGAPPPPPGPGEGDRGGAERLQEGHRRQGSRSLPAGVPRREQGQPAQGRAVLPADAEPDPGLPGREHRHHRRRRHGQGSPLRRPRPQGRPGDPQRIGRSSSASGRRRAAGSSRR